MRREPDHAHAMIHIVSEGSGSSVRVIGSLIEQAGPVWKDRLRQSLSRVHSFDNLMTWTLRWQRRLTEVVGFPASPILASQQLVPLATADAMRHEAHEMQNCLDTMVASVLEGSTYFFRWDGGAVPATVMLERTPEAGWQFQEALGFDNEPLDQQTESYIRSLVQARLALSTTPPVLNNGNMKEISP